MFSIGDIVKRKGYCAGYRHRVVNIDDPNIYACKKGMMSIETIVKRGAALQTAQRPVWDNIDEYVLVDGA